MGHTASRKTETDEFSDNSISEEEAVLAARRAFDFLTTCVQGDISGITISERINAARGILEHSARVPRLLDSLMEGAGLLSEEDVVTIAAALD